MVTVEPGVEGLRPRLRATGLGGRCNPPGGAAYASASLAEGEGLPEAGLPLYAARWVEEVVRLAGRGVRLDSWWGRWRARRVLRLLHAGLQRLGLGEYVACVRLDAGPSAGASDPGSGATPAVRAEAELVASLLAGRILLETEVGAAAGVAGISVEAALAAAEALAEEGRLWRTAAVEVDPGGAVCRRCGSRDGIVPDICGRCGSTRCPRCTRCASMGVARGCLALYAKAVDGEGGPGESATGGSWSLQPPLIEGLTPAQRGAFEALRSAVQAHLDGRGGGDGAGQAAGGAGRAAGRERPVGPAGALIWAVTGAGKTEVAFGGAEVVLQRGGSVLFCVPRRDVATEIASRCRQAFSGGPIRLLVGGQGEGLRDRLPTWPVAGSLVVATTHQALRLYQAFSMVIVDEADAFPYRGSAMLEQAVERALRPGGFAVAMSATPGRLWMERARARGWRIITVPVRHHGYPLPVPRLWCHRAVARWQERPGDPRRVPAPLRRWLAEREPDARVLVFVPTVALAEQVARALGVPFCHSRDPRRDQKLAAFRGGRGTVLVCTTLLERGVTFEGLDVLVLFADVEAIFDESALIQMAGRAGRSARRPWGRVLFAAARATPAIRRAVETIRGMNREAARMGLLRGGSAGAQGSRAGSEQGGIMRGVQQAGEEGKTWGVGRLAAAALQGSSFARADRQYAPGPAEEDLAGGLSFRDPAEGRGV